MSKKQARINVQQLPKSEGILTNFVARPGYVLVDSDLCLHPKTELLTKQRGWIPVLDLSDTDLVWQVEPESLTGSWIKPKQLIQLEYNGDMHTYGNDRGTLSVTTNHKMLWIGQQTHKRQDKVRYRKISYSQEGVPNSGCHMALASTHESISNYDTHDIWISCMLQADGSKIHNREAYRIELKKEFKIEKAKRLLGPESGISNRGTTCWNYVKFRSELISTCKEKRLNLRNIGSNQCEEFLAALSFWDGHVTENGTIEYTTTNKHNADEIQAYLVRCGYECKIKCTRQFNSNWSDYYTLRINKHKGVRLRPNVDVNVESYHGTVGCVTVDTGFILVRSDGQTFVTGNCSIEPSVQAVFSKDEMLWELYASGRTHDMYLFNGLHLLKPLFPERAALLNSMYIAGDPEAIAACKKEFKYERDKILKAAVLSDAYGAGAGSWHKQFRKAGIDVEFSTVKRMKELHEAKYKGLAAWKEQLHREWRLNNGWITTGAFGRPRCVSPDVVKDLANIFTQSTAHDVLLMLIRSIEIRVDERGIEAYPWIDDFHDQTTWEVREDQVDQLVTCFREAYDELNDTLKWPIRVTGDIDIGTNLWEFKQ